MFPSSWGSKELEPTGQARLQLKAMFTFPQLLKSISQHTSTKVPNVAIFLQCPLEATHI